MSHRKYRALILNDYEHAQYAEWVKTGKKPIETRMGRMFSYRGDLVICCGKTNSVGPNAGKALCIVELYDARPMKNTPDEIAAACIEWHPKRKSHLLRNWRHFSRDFEFKDYATKKNFQGIFEIEIPDDVAIIPKPEIKEFSDSLDQPPVEVTTGQGTFLFIPVPDQCVNFVCDMGYLIYDQPDYNNWVTDDELWDFEKLEKYMARTEGASGYKKGARKLPDTEIGPYSFVGATKTMFADTHPNHQNITEEKAYHIVDNNGMNCWDNYRLKKDEKYTCTSAMQSLRCLMETAGLKDTCAYAVVKRGPFKLAYPLKPETKPTTYSPKDEQYCPECFQRVDPGQAECDNCGLQMNG